LRVRGVRLPASAEGFGEARRSALRARRRQPDQIAATVQSGENAQPFGSTTMSDGLLLPTAGANGNPFDIRHFDLDMSESPTCATGLCAPLAKAWIISGVAAPTLIARIGV